MNIRYIKTTDCTDLTDSPRKIFGTQASNEYGFLPAVSCLLPSVKIGCLHPYNFGNQISKIRLIRS